MVNFHADTAFVRLAAGGITDNELPRIFEGYRPLHYEDVEAPAEWGGAVGGGNRIVRLLAKRPASPPSAFVFQGRNFAHEQTPCWGSITLRCEPKGWVRAGPCENSGKND